jgi:phospholipase D1/2
VDFLENTVGESLFRRISRAMAEKQRFKAVVLLPAYPGFEGDPVTSYCVRAVLLYQLGSIRRLKVRLGSFIMYEGNEADRLAASSGPDSGVRWMCLPWPLLQAALAHEHPGVDVNEYLAFYCLRSYDVFMPSGRAVTDHVYIHSKFMIVDDRVAVIGSANLNDR